MYNEIKINWKEEMSFDVYQNGQHFVIDGDSDAGELRPKALMLSALAGCSGMDVSMLMRKMRATPDSLEIKVKGFLTDSTPKVYEKAIIEYYFAGDSLKEKKLIKAVDMSLQQYCGVSDMFKAFANVEAEIYFNGQLHIRESA